MKASLTEATDRDEEAARLLEELDELIRATTHHVEIRPIECRREFDYDKGVVRLIRTDTGDCLQRRPLRQDEQQQTLGVELKETPQGKDGYIDRTRRILFVSDGESEGTVWAVYYRGHTGSMKRYVAAGLKEKSTRKHAERMLEKYAAVRGFQHTSKEQAEANG